MKVAIKRGVPRWAVPLKARARYKGAKGGRSSGKSHFYAEEAVEEMVTDPTLRFVCIREVQRSLKFSAKSLVEAKIRSLGVPHLFTVLTTEIRRNGGSGIMIFEGMQDHTADSLKSLEGFDRAWVEEAQSLSKRSLELLTPTLRAEGSQIWFSWNCEQPDDPVDQFFQDLAGDAFPYSSGAAAGDGFALVHVNYLDNPFCPVESFEEAARTKRVDPDAYAHIWLGQYNVKTQAQVLHGKWHVDEFEPDAKWDGPYHGADHGFAQDPRTLVKCWIGPHAKYGKRCLYIERESHHVELGIDKAAERWQEDVPGFARYVVRADSAEPGTIDYLRRHGVPKIESVKKWQGSIEDGVAHLRQYDAIIIHVRCVHAQEEARLYRYKVDKHTGDIMPQIEDKNNHIWDGVRYALAPLIYKQGFDLAFSPPIGNG
jgi:phage terminase large subunit